MIRRGFWLVTGAVLGVTGYRRASRLTRAVTGKPRHGGVLPSGPQLPGAIHLRWRSPLALTARAPASAARPVRPAERIASSAGFGREMRQAMAEYWYLHRGDADRTLGGQGTQTTSGDASSSRASAGWAFPGGGERNRPGHGSSEQGSREPGAREPGAREPGAREQAPSARDRRQP